MRVQEQCLSGSQWQSIKPLYRCETRFSPSPLCFNFNMWKADVRLHTSVHQQLTTLTCNESLSEHFPPIHWPCGWWRLCWWKPEAVDVENCILVPTYRTKCKTSLLIMYVIILYCLNIIAHLSFFIFSYYSCSSSCYLTLCQNKAGFCVQAIMKLVRT